MTISQIRKNKMLFDAVRGKASCEYIEHLITNVGSDVNAQDDKAQTVLMKAIKSNRYPEVIRTLIKRGAHTDTTCRGVTPLMYSVLKNKNTVAEMLLKQGADCNATCRGISPLIYSLLKKENKLAEMLIKAGADVNAKYRDKTALMIAAKYATATKIVGLMIDNGADVKARDRKGRTASDFAQFNRNREITNLLQPL